MGFRCYCSGDKGSKRSSFIVREKQQSHVDEFPLTSALLTVANSELDQVMNEPVEDGAGSFSPA